MARPVPIRVRLAALFAAGTALVIGVGGALFVNELSQALSNSLATAIESRAALIVNSSRGRPSVDLGESRPAANAGTFAQVLGPDGHVVSWSGPEARAALVDPAVVASLSSHARLVERGLGDGDDAVVYLERIGRGQVLLVGTSMQTVDEAIDNIEASLLVGGPIAVVLAAVASYLLAGAALHPVERLRRQAASISEHDEASSLDVPRTDDEVAALARTLNELLARLQGALGRQRGFVAAAGHELRTPLANLKLELELARRPGRDAGDLAVAIAGATDEVERLASIADRLLMLAQSDEHAELVVCRRLDVVPVLRAAVESFAGIAAERRVLLELVVAEEALEAEVDDVALHQIVGNLLDNSLRYAPDDSTVQVGARASEEELRLEVSDEGSGFPPEFLPQAFERFSRPDSARRRDGGGVGLGLSIVKSLVEAHGGTVTVANRRAGGAVARVALPRRGPATRVEGAAPAGAVVVGR